MSDLATYRKSQRLTQTQLASAFGLRSKGHWSRIERGLEACPMKLALRIEDVSDGEILATSVVEPEDAQLLTRYADRAIARALRSAEQGHA
ncbi:MAG: hypothetical protein DI526_01420 [Caulobacter segnis]|uniref:HTH cro/C1-type domain-containing protein n=1 Tax=Caulobacter segnis TaxID=88688 RepID=A0A2W5X839_9CAUL|nr:MAG: hypothetical protein DI526_01420 [Caulobacter segnis]